MDTVPQIISTKDLSYLEDMFNWNYTAFKQINHFISEVQDEGIKELLERVKNMHEDHLHFIITIMKKEEFEECECNDCDCDECDCEEDDDEE